MKLELRKECVSLLSRGEHRYFITLNFSRPVYEAEARRTMTIFMNTLNNQVFGKKSKRRLKSAVYLETNQLDGFHYHITIQDPVPLTPRVQGKRFDHMVKEIWEGIDGPTARVRQSCPDGTSWFKEIENPEQLGWYLTKQLSKRPDVIQVEHCHW